MARFWTVFSLLFMTIGCDQLTKVIARKYLAGTDGHEFFGGFFSLQFTENPGAFLSLGAQFEAEHRFWVFTVLVSIVLAVATYFLFKKSMDWLTTVGLTLLIGGGVGNLIDRVAKGTVTDFLLIDIGVARTGIFNIADVVIMAGFAMLFLDSLRSSERDSATV